ADGKLAEGEPWIQESVIGSRFVARYRWIDRDKGTVAPTITGSAYVNGEATLLLNPRDPVLVSGHPATVLSEPAATPASSPPATATASASTLASPSSAASPSASSAASGGGDTELLMADGNRTFVITIPFGKVSGSDAVTVLTNVAALVYQHTLPAGGSSATAAPTTSPKTSPQPSAS
ncbi:proline racemase family protein, partial [Actinocrinis sp.]|uniref:proline racemase family protein n=1 Tax=Actinocrinis sp. TaxID=1920516 RepID=UPI002D3D7116